MSVLICSVTHLLTFFSLSVFSSAVERSCPHLSGCQSSPLFHATALTHWLMMSCTKDTLFLATHTHARTHTHSTDKWCFKADTSLSRFFSVIYLPNYLIKHMQDIQMLLHSFWTSYSRIWLEEDSAFCRTNVLVMEPVKKWWVFIAQYAVHNIIEEILIVFVVFSHDALAHSLNVFNSLFFLTMLRKSEYFERHH